MITLKLRCLVLFYNSGRPTTLKNPVQDSIMQHSKLEKIVRQQQKIVTWLKQLLYEVTCDHMIYNFKMPIYKNLQLYENLQRNSILMIVKLKRLQVICQKTVQGCKELWAARYSK